MSYRDPVREALRQCADCLDDVASGKGGWAWEEVLNQARAALAAPSVYDDMLAALKKITNNWGHLHPKDYAQAMSAIRKAEGKS